MRLRLFGKFSSDWNRVAARADDSPSRATTALEGRCRRVSQEKKLRLRPTRLREKHETEYPRDSSSQKQIPSLFLAFPRTNWTNPLSSCLLSVSGLSRGEAFREPIVVQNLTVPHRGQANRCTSSIFSYFSEVITGAASSFQCQDVVGMDHIRLVMLLCQ